MNESIGTIIMRLRKENGMTQEQLAKALGITFQAVSKWENGISSPDISALPLLADLFDVSVDQLLGRQELELSFPLQPEEPEQPEETQYVPEECTEEAEILPVPAPAYQKETGRDALPWPDDETFYAVLYHGHQLLGYLSGDAELAPAKKHFQFTYEGKAQNVYSDFSVEIKGDVAGNVSAGEKLSCGDVGGSAEAGTSVECGDVDGDVHAGTFVECADVDGHVFAGSNVSCADVDGNVKAGGSVRCGEVEGSVVAGGSVDCDDVSGSVVSGSMGKFEDLSKSMEGFSKDMDDFGVRLGEKISRAVEKATRYGFRYGRGNQDEKDDD